MFAKSPMSHQKSGDQRAVTFGDETEETRETDNNNHRCACNYMIEQ